MKLFVLVSLSLIIATIAQGQDLSEWEKSVQEATPEVLLKNRFKSSMKAHSSQTIGVVSIALGVPSLAYGIADANNTHIEDLPTATIVSLAGGAVLSIVGLLTVVNSNNHKRKALKIENELFRRKNMQLSLNGAGFSFWF